MGKKYKRKVAALHKKIRQLNVLNGQAYVRVLELEGDLYAAQADQKRAEIEMVNLRKRRTEESVE